MSILGQYSIQWVPKPSIKRLHTETNIWIFVTKEHGFSYQNAECAILMSTVPNIRPKIDFCASVEKKNVLLVIHNEGHEDISYFIDASVWEKLG